MEKVEFMNKMWITGKPRIWEHLLIFVIGIYCVSQIMVFWFEGFDVRSGICLIFAIVGLGIYRNQHKRKGRYVENKCILIFSDNQIEWEYPQIQIDGTRRQIHILYKIRREDILDIALSHEMHSIRVASKPIMFISEGKKERVTDFHKKKKACVLILYHPKIDELSLLIKKYLKVNIYTVD